MDEVCGGCAEARPSLRSSFALALGGCVVFYIYALGTFMWPCGGARARAAWLVVGSRPTRYTIRGHGGPESAASSRRGGRQVVGKVLCTMGRVERKARGAISGAPRRNLCPLHDGRGRRSADGDNGGGAPARCPRRPRRRDAGWDAIVVAAGIC